MILISTVDKGSIVGLLQYFEKMSKESVKNPGKAWKEVNRLLDGGSNKGIYALRTN